MVCLNSCGCKEKAYSLAEVRIRRVFLTILLQNSTIGLGMAIDRPKVATAGSQKGILNENG
jgi:hypothetical protein